MILILTKQLLLAVTLVFSISSLVYGQKAYGVIDGKLLHVLTKGNRSVDRINAYELSGDLSVKSYTSVPEVHNYQFNACWKIHDGHYIVVTNSFGTSFGNTARMFKYSVNKMDSMALRQKRIPEIDSMVLIYGTRERALMKKALAKAKDQTNRTFIPFHHFRKNVLAAEHHNQVSIKDCSYDVNVVKLGDSTTVIAFFKSAYGLQKWHLDLEDVERSGVSYDVLPLVVEDSLLFDEDKNTNYVDENFFVSTFTTVQLGGKIFMINFQGGFIYDVTNSFLRVIGKVNYKNRLAILEDKDQDVVYLNGQIIWINADGETQKRFRTVSGDALQAAAELLLENEKL